MYAYIDESGNTGGNLLDVDQPYFFSMAMSSRVDFDDVFRDRVDRIAQSVNMPYLHASELGVRGVEVIAPRLIDLIEFSQVQFYSVYVVKRDVVAAKFFDAVFDPGENPAASNHSYGVRPLRYVLLLKFVSLMDMDDAQLFWEAMSNRQTPASEMKAITAIDNILLRLGNLRDTRSRQLIGDTLRWAKDNIGSFSFWSSGKRERFAHLPNIFTLPALFDGIYKFAKAWNDNIEKIIHDQQGQFGASLKQWHQFRKELDPEPIHYFGDMKFQFPDIRNSKFEITDSRKSPGLQVVDVVLWTLSRIALSKEIGPMSRKLFKLCISPGDMYILSLEWIEAEAEHLVNTYMNKPMTEDQLIKGQELLSRAEQTRQDRIRGPFDAHNSD